eukprot:TRINITY_DN8270_c1_g1_i1.p1 TRINITY_DN8270_c1_g1~~TRINITY_DN8270_c1_g1_i1.p1  ORF type:complete len:1754 (+),score=300.74 TRINITY_DN8270_c1_g1_i1:84-5345(+)
MSLPMMFVVLMSMGGSCPCLNRCDSGDVPVYQTNDGSCFRLFWRSTTWDDAATECMLDGGMLTEPLNVETATFLTEHVTVFQQYVWVGITYNSMLSQWVYSDSGGVVPSVLWEGGVPPVSSTQNCAFISRDGLLYPWVCTETMVHVCQKRIVQFAPAIHQPTLAAAAGLTIELQGEGIDVDIYLHTSLDGCTSTVDPRVLLQVYSKSGGYFVDLPPLQNTNTYNLCWYGPVKTNNVGGAVSTTATGIQIRVPSKPYLTPGELAVADGEQTIHLKGNNLTKDIWLMINCDSQTSRGTPSVVSLASNSDGTAAFVNVTADLFPKSLYDVKMTVCLATGFSDANVADLVFEPTGFYVVRKSPPIFVPVNVALTYADSLLVTSPDGLEIPLSGTHLDQLIYITLSTHPLCSDSSMVATMLRHTNDTHGSLLVTHIPFFGQPLYICYSLQQPQEESVLWSASGCSLYATPEPRFDQIIVDGEPVDFVQKVSQKTVAEVSAETEPTLQLTIPGRYLSTYSRADSLLWVVYSVNGDCSPGLYTLPSKPVQLKNSSPLGAEAHLPLSDFSPNVVVSICIIPSVTEPSLTSHSDFGSIILNSYFGVKILGMPSFSPQHETISVVHINQTIAIYSNTDTNIPMLDVTVGASLSNCVDAVPVTVTSVDGELHEPDHIVVQNLSGVLPGVGGITDEPFTLSICYSFTPTVGWNRIGVQKEVLPYPTVLYANSDSPFFDVATLDVTQSRTSALTVSVFGEYIMTSMTVHLCQYPDTVFSLSCKTDTLTYCSEAVFVVTADILVVADGSEMPLAVCFYDEQVKVSVRVLQPPQLFSEGSESLNSISKGLWEEGFSWEIPGKNVGRIWVAFTDKQQCDETRLPASAVQITGDMNSSLAVVQFSPRDYRLHKIDTLYSLCWRSDTPNTVISQFPIPIIVRTLPSFRESEIVISRTDFVSLQSTDTYKILPINMALYAVDLSASVTTMGILCQANPDQDCASGCTQPFLIVYDGDSNALLDQSLLSSPDTINYDLCWMTNGIKMPEGIMSGSYQATAVSVSILGDPIFDYIGPVKARLHEVTYPQQEQPVIITARNVRGNVFVGILEVGGDCKNRVLARIVNDTAIEWTPETITFPSGIYEICYGFTQGQSTTFKSTLLQYGWEQPPQFTPWTYHISLIDIGSDGPELSLRGQGFSPGISAKIVKEGDSCSTTMYASRMIEDAKFKIPIIFTNQYYGGPYDLCWGITANTDSAWEKSPGVTIILNDKPTFDAQIIVNISAADLLSGAVTPSGGAWQHTTEDVGLIFYGWLCLDVGLQHILFDVTSTGIVLSQSLTDEERGVHVDALFSADNKQQELCWSVSPTPRDGSIIRSGVFVSLPTRPPPPPSPEPTSTQTIPVCDSSINTLIKEDCFDDILVGCYGLNTRLEVGDCDNSYLTCVDSYVCVTDNSDPIATLILTLTGVIEDYSNTMLMAIVSASTLVHPSQVVVKSVASGSIVVTLALPQKAAVDISQNTKALNADNSSPFSKFGWTITDTLVADVNQTEPPQTVISDSDDSQQFIIPILAAVAVLGLVILGVLLKKLQLIGDSSPNDENSQVTGRDVCDLVQPPSRGGSEGTTIAIGDIEMLPPVPPIRSSTGCSSLVEKKSLPSVVSVASSTKPASRHLAGNNDFNLVLTTPTPTKPGGPGGGGQGGGGSFLAHHTDSVTFGQNRSTDSLVLSSAPHPVSNASNSKAPAASPCSQCGHPWSGGRFCAHCGFLVRRAVPVPVPHP